MRHRPAMLLPVALNSNMDGIVALDEDVGDAIGLETVERGLSSVAWRRLVVVAVAILAAANIALRIWTAVRMRGPVVNADEASYLAQARLIAGASAFGRTDYFPGYSIVISPVYWFGSLGLQTQYQLVIVLNILLAVVGAGAAYLICRLAGPTLDRSVSLLVVISVAAIPSWLGYSSLAMAENALIPGVLVGLAVAGWAFVTDRGWALGAAGLVAGLLYSVHPRAGAIPVALGICGATHLCWHGRRRRLAWLLGGIVAGGVVSYLVVADFAVKRGPGDVTNTYSYRGLAARLFDGGVLHDVPATLLGHVGYLVVAGSILFVVGVLYAAGAAHRVLVGASSPADVVAATALVAQIFMLGISVLYWSNVPDRADAPLYGRYAEPVAVAIVLLGGTRLAGLAASPEGRRQVLILGGTTCLILMTALLATLFLVDRGTFDVEAGWVNIPALKQLLSSTGVDVWRVIMVGSVVTLVVTVLAAVRAELALLAIAALGLLLHGIDAAPEWIRASVIRSEERELTTAIVTYFDDQGCVGYDRRTPQAWHITNYWYFIGDADLRYYTGGVEQPCGDLFISADPSTSTDYPDARVLAIENDVPQWLWVRAGLQNRVADRLFPGNPFDPLPSSARQSRIEVVEPSTADPVALGSTLKVRVEHQGSGSPWPNFRGLLGSIGYVDLALRWYEPGGTTSLGAEAIALPRTLYPGESISLEVPLNGAEWLEPSREYDLELIMVQEGVEWFPPGSGTVLSVTT